ncbi:MAG TPA: DUF72 domain-containing protein [Casimicrobiaceae bacterium]|nr:DUF72 domain-containing protein [Casimicrobiaceae bacterium]
MAKRQRSSEQRGTIRVGLSGWRYVPWRGVFYPKGLAQRRELEYASRRFSTIEINGSFYALQRPDAYARWHDETPDDFVFSVKGGRYITHMLRLRNCATALANFFASGIANLGAKLGPILWQLPPSYAFDRAALDAFLRELPGDTDEASALARRHDDKVAGRVVCRFSVPQQLRYALEVRHATFVDEAFVDLLRQHRIALVVADTAGRWPYAEDLTAGFTYVRLHGDEELYVSGYSDAALDQWCDRLIAWSEGRAARDARLISSEASSGGDAHDVFCYFDNDAKVMAPRDAQALYELIRKAGARVAKPAGTDIVGPIAGNIPRHLPGARESWPAVRSRVATRKP